MRRLRLFTLASLVAAGCVGQTGGDTVAFPVAAAGPVDAVAGQPLAFTAGGFAVALTRATLHVGAVYLGQSRPTSGGQATGCYLTGTYLAEETSARDVDLLDPSAQRFAAPARGITLPPALVGEVWLTGGDINAPADTTPILAVAGTASRDSTVIPFSAVVTIGTNREPQTSGAAGGSPICKARIVTPIPAPVTLRATGGLLLRIDPRALFEAVDFSQVPLDAQTGVAIFPDGPGLVPAQNLFSNLHSVAPYTFTWSDAL